MPALNLTDLDKSRPIHLVGIAGSAMSGLASIFRGLGFTVRGTDPRAETAAHLLTPLGIELFTEQDGSRLAPNTGLTVITQAVSEDHPEVRAARAAGIPVVTYPECIGALMASRFGVAVAGTHGKTTVTAMTVTALNALGTDPGFVVGGFVPELGAGAAAGSGPFFVAEACEFNRSFLSLRPKVAVITNIEADHLDVYAGLEEIQDAFRAFAEKLVGVEGGTLLYWAGCPNTPPVIRSLDVPTCTFGLAGEGADITATQIRTAPEGTAFNLVIEGRKVCEARLRVFGKHNILNALAAVALCRTLGIDPAAAIRALETFTGAKRRFEMRGEAAGVSIVDDYAHHPTAVRLLVEAARERFADKRIVVVFQPHQYSRTRLMLDDFATALAGADRVVIPNIYFARDTEADVKALRPEALAEAVSARGTEACYVGDLPRTVELLAETLTPGDLVILAGAGDIDSAANPLLAALRNRSI